MYFLFTLFSVIAGGLLLDNYHLCIPILCLGQLAMLIRIIRERDITGGGAFLFMSFLFFAVRPLYMWMENDYRLYEWLFKIDPSHRELNLTIWWSTMGMWTFQWGRDLSGILHRRRWAKARKRQAKEGSQFFLVGVAGVGGMFAYQVFSLVVMLYLATAGRGLYGSALGAYMYDLPSVLEAGHIFTLVILAERLLRQKDLPTLILTGVGGILFLAFTLEMRAVSVFRGFYLAGVMIGGLAVLARLFRKVNALWLIIPIALVLPVFRLLGQMRHSSNGNLSSTSVAARQQNESFFQSYWDFYDSDGDMNIYDTFVAARMSKPATHPYILSWLYVPVHLVPRAVWPSKPEKGQLVDLDFMYGAPYCPGLIGFFYLDGGSMWMLLSMLVLGYLISFLDRVVLALPRSYLRCALFGVLVVNGMMLSRQFLWQYFYASLYFITPCLVFAKLTRLTLEGKLQAKRLIGPQARDREAVEALPAPVEE